MNIGWNTYDTEKTRTTKSVALLADNTSDRISECQAAHKPRTSSAEVGATCCATYPPVDADLEFGAVMHSTLCQSSRLSPHAVAAKPV